jgi:hypothetical protein
MQPTAQKWTCDRCGVTASRLDGEPTTQPSSWTNSDDGRFCLLCRRARAGEAALERAPSDTPRDKTQQLRRTGLIEFEMRRLPDQRDGHIASACGTSPSTVAAVRRALAAADSPGE